MVSLEFLEEKKPHLPASKQQGSMALGVELAAGYLFRSAS
jgi:hypothetical protein